MKKCFYFFILFIPSIGCRKPYDPPAIASSNGYLVVAGVVNPGSDSTIITLSHTVKISSKTGLNPVLGASVAVESDQNFVFPLVEAGSGNYVSAGLNLDKSHQYRITIKTADNKQYYSDFEPVVVTPPIDSIGFNVGSSDGQTGVQVYANTHDPTNSLNYYRWSYEEEWVFFTKYSSAFVSNGTALVARQPSQYITYCYNGGPSNTIILGSSAKLSQHLIYQNPIVFVPSTSEKIEDRYTVLVHQYALSSGAYDFWTNLKQNTEQLGSIFDAQPSEVPGNLHCSTNPAESVIGYISVGTVSSKRIFIYKDQLPQWLPTYPYVCDYDTTGQRSGVGIGDLINYPEYYLGIVALGNPSLPGTQYMWTERDCADCTIRGTIMPPPYWK